MNTLQPQVTKLPIAVDTASIKGLAFSSYTIIHMLTYNLDHISLFFINMVLDVPISCSLEQHAVNFYNGVIKTRCQVISKVYNILVCICSHKGSPCRDSPLLHP